MYTVCNIHTHTYREANTTHITYKDGMQLIHFPNNQMEKHYPDGSREVLNPKPLTLDSKP